MKKGNAKAPMPILLFLILYPWFLFEYGLKIEMGFYSIPIVVIFLIALMGKDVDHKDVLIIILILLTAGSFSDVIGLSGANSVAYFLRSIFPAKNSVAMFFVIAGFVSTAIGTPVETITLISPIVLSLSQASGYSMSRCLGSIIGGAIFGDNLSFIPNRYH